MVNVVVEVAMENMGRKMKIHTGCCHMSHLGQTLREGVRVSLE